MSKFPTVFLKEGYAMDEVDAFMSSVENLSQAEKRSAAQNVRFTPCRLRKSYDVRAVDEFLDNIS